MTLKKSKQPKNTTILLIEDDDFLASMYQTKLEIEGYKVLMANDGEKGLAMIKKHKPDLVLLDIVLPKLDGFGVLKEVKKSKVLSSIPVILLTNLSQKEDVQKGFDLKADDYLIKAHYMPSEVITKIKKTLNT
ncbi:response regulator [Candidatus Parcubacteria bacterium]|nr:response regulator [Patescibacteria group bacterium]MCG2686913.1 response regulator [Candidatus Parcubacteria bacterium]